MKALKITSEDATCLSAALSAGLLSESTYGYGYAAVPDAFGHAVSVTTVAKKSGSYVCLEFPDGSQENIISIKGDSPEEALNEACVAAASDAADPEDLAWWRDI